MSLYFRLIVFHAFHFFLVIQSFVFQDNLSFRLMSFMANVFSGMANGRMAIIPPRGGCFPRAKTRESPAQVWHLSDSAN